MANIKCKGCGGVTTVPDEFTCNWTNCEQCKQSVCVSCGSTERHDVGASDPDEEYCCCLICNNCGSGNCGGCT